MKYICFVFWICLLNVSWSQAAAVLWPPNKKILQANHEVAVTQWFGDNLVKHVTHDGGNGSISFSAFLSEVGKRSNTTYLFEASPNPYITGCLGDKYIRIGPYGAENDVTNILIKSATGNRRDVVIAGADPAIDPGFWKSAQYGGPSSCGDYQFINIYHAHRIVIADITFRNFPGHILKLDGQTSWKPEQIIFSNLELLDCGDQIIKGHTCRNGILQGCYIHYTDGLFPQSSYETQGFNLHNSDNWTIRDNLFENCRIPKNSAHGANSAGVLCWNGSDSIRVERNLFINCDAAVKLGMSASKGKGDYFWVSNNIVINTDTDDLYSNSHPNVFDVGPGAVNGGFFHNTVWNPAHSPSITLVRTENSAFRFENNLYYTGRINRAAASKNNLKVSDNSWFVSVGAWDFRLRTNRIVPRLAEVSAGVSGKLRANPASAGAFEHDMVPVKLGRTPISAPFIHAGEFHLVITGLQDLYKIPGMDGEKRYINLQGRRLLPRTLPAE